ALREDQQLLAVSVLRQKPERHGAARPYARDGVQATLEFLWRMIGAADDHQVLGSARDIKFAVEAKAQIPRIQPALRKPGARGIETPEIAQHHRGGADVDAPHPAIGKAIAPGIPDFHLGSRQWFAHGDNLEITIVGLREAREPGGIYRDGFGATGEVRVGD